MHISHVKIANILGIEDLEFDAGAFTAIEGPNGAGKTSVLEAIKAVMRGGEDATLLRAGAERGEVVLVLDDGTELKRRLTAKGSTTIVEKDGIRTSQPAGTIKALHDMLSMNPVDFLRYGSTAAGKKQRLAAMLECLPIQADPERLEDIAGDAATVADPNASALEQIDAIYQSIYVDRTNTNRAIREKEGSINQLSATLPEPADGVVSADVTELEAAVAKLDEERDAAFARVDTKLETIRTEHDAKLAELRAQVDTIRDDIEKRIGVMSENEQRAAKQREIDTNKHATAKAPIAAQIAAVRNNQEASIKARTTRDNIKNLRSEADQLQEDADSQTTALEALQAYKVELLASLPISGLEVRDGEIFRNDIPFDRLNSQQQVEIAVEIAKLRAGELGVICVDGLELLDREHFETFRDRAKDSGLQLFVTRVTDGEFAVNLS